MTTIETNFRHLLELCRALRLAEKGNLTTGIKPNPDAANSLRTALDHFIPEQSRKIEG